METLAPDAELVSPLSGRMVFRGKEDLRLLLSAVYSNIHGLRWDQQIGSDDTQVMLGGGRVGPFQITDAMVFELAPDGRIKRIRPHLRPWLGTTLLALMLAGGLSRRPSVLYRALRR